MISTIAFVLVSLVLSAAQIGFQEAVQATGNSISKNLTNMARQLYNKIMTNNDLLENLSNAYANKDSQMLNELLMSNGFDMRAAAIREAREKEKSKFQETKKRIVNENTDLQNKYNKATNDAAYAGSNIANNIRAQETAQEIEQAIKGGINENGLQTTQKL